jgi:hypothetical protein
MKKLTITFSTIALLLGCFALSLTVQAARDASQPTFTQIDVPGSVFTIANGINQKGDIVGAYIDSRGGLHGFLLSNGAFTTIDPPGGNLTVALHINPEGVITGLYRTSDSNIHGFLLSNGAFMSIDVPGARSPSSMGLIRGAISRVNTVTPAIMFTVSC